ncbi:carboxymuconolactone decarboxylase family protein [Nocardia carnea]|uniref:carboxymuconolactone decarboxylase family protein n=1 Tax=Nocardia carnea TaxID=37328 RepID=UPI0024573CA8|nr:carboxymuconolactone decarboxylase family protein [Nocardia carnea]
MTTVGSRLTPLPAADWTEQGRAMLRGRLKRADQYLSGDSDAPPLPNILGILGHHPELGGAWLAYNGLLLERATLDPRLRELAILRVAWRTRSAYEWDQHSRMARDLGISVGTIEDIACGETAHWPDVDRLVLAATDELLDRYRVCDSTWTALTAHLDTRQLLELLFVAGSYLCLALVTNSVDLQPDPPAGSATTAHDSVREE